MEDNVAYMFNIPLFIHDGYADPMDDCTQYHALEWKLKDMEKYNVYSIGRYGGWTYCSMEDCMLEAKNLSEKIN